MAVKMASGYFVPEFPGVFRKSCHRLPARLGVFGFRLIPLGYKDDYG
jgi:hypothetical protein